MSKKLIGIAFMTIMLFGIFGLTACDNVSLADYRAKGKASIDAHVATKTPSDYSTEKWTDILSIATVGKQAVEDATNMDAVDTEVEKTKEEIDEVKIQLKHGIYITDDGIATIELYGANSFRFSMTYMIFFPTGIYTIINGKLILNYTDNRELVFDIEDDQVVFVGTNIDGQFAEDGPIKVGTVFKWTVVEVVAEDMVDCASFYFNEIASFPWRPVVLKYTDENAVFDCTVNKGTFVLLGNSPQYINKLTIEPGGEFFWQPYDRDTDGNIISENSIKQTFVEIILRIDENIVGYAVVEIYQVGEPGVFYKARNLKSVLFPKIEGECQNISESQIKSIIEQIKEEK